MFASCVYIHTYVYIHVYNYIGMFACVCVCVCVCVCACVCVHTCIHTYIHTYAIMTQVEMILAEHEPAQDISEIADLFWAAVQGDWLSSTLPGR